VRRFLLLITSLIIFQKGYFQNINIAGHYGIDASGGMISINSKSYYIKRVTASCCYDKIFVVGLDAGGQTMFSKELTYTGADYLKKIIRTSDDGIVVLGSTQPACDVGGTKDFIAKVDTNGALIFKTIVSSAWASSYYGITAIAGPQDSTILMAFDSLLISYSENGQYLSELSPGLKGINAVLPLTNGNLLINGKLNNVLTNIEYDPLTYSIVTQQTANYAVSKFSQMPNGTIIALSVGGEIVRYNAGLSFISYASTLTTTNLRTTDFVTRKDSVFVTGTNTLSQSPFYGILDINFGVLAFAQSNYKGISPTGISLTDASRVNIITTGSSSVSKMVTFNGLFQLGINGYFYSAADIGVTNVTGASSIVKSFGSSAIFVPDLSVTVKNYGTDTVKSFYLNHYMPGFQLCSNLFHKLYQTAIAPGATVSLQMGTFSIQTYFSMPPGSQAGSTARVNMCFFTTVPDFKNDIEIDNDAFCDSILFTLTSIGENRITEEGFHMYPNPFKDGFTIDSDRDIKTIELMNSLGVLIKKEVIDSRKFFMDASALPPGIYFIKLNSDKGTGVQKIIKN